MDICTPFNRINKHFGSDRVTLHDIEHDSEIGIHSFDVVIDGFGKFFVDKEVCFQYMEGKPWEQNANAQFVHDIALGKVRDADGNMIERSRSNADVKSE